MLDMMRPWLGRVIGAAVGFVSAFLSTKVGAFAAFGPEEQAAITGTIVVGVYALVHKLVDSKINPTDAASQVLAVKGKAEDTAATPKPAA